MLTKYDSALRQEDIINTNWIKKNLLLAHYNRKRMEKKISVLELRAGISALSLELSKLNGRRRENALSNS